MRVRLAFVACVVLAVLAGACSSSSNPEPSASSTTPGVSPTSASASPTSSGPLQNPAVAMTKGRAQVKVTGQLKATLDLPLGPQAVFSPVPGQITLVWLDREANAVLIAGPTFSGQARTSKNLTLTIVVQGSKANAFVSAQGECKITIVRASDNGVDGRFSCQKLSRGGKTVNATGTFSASR